MVSIVITVEDDLEYFSLCLVLLLVSLKRTCSLVWSVPICGTGDVYYTLEGTQQRFYFLSTSIVLYISLASGDFNINILIH